MVLLIWALLLTLFAAANLSIKLLPLGVPSPARSDPLIAEVTAVSDRRR